MNTDPKPADDIRVLKVGEVPASKVAVEELQILATVLLRRNKGRVIMTGAEIHDARKRIHRLKTITTYDGTGVPCIAAECLD